ncbi:MAG: ABC transporter ATP-binding protein, partial [Mesorhizobium sp.]
MEELVAIHNQHVDVADRPEAKPIRITKARIDFENVHFRYANHPLPLYSECSLSIEAGERVGLVGPSGSGKTTFVKLIQRLYDLSGGRILIDGQDVSEVTQESLRSQIAIVQQEPILFHRSLAENIAYGRPGASQAEIEQAARLASAHEFIAPLPKGYGTLVGERGLKLSGGERQRVAIARALVRDPNAYLMDDPISALDARLREETRVELKRIQRELGKTLIYVTHDQEEAMSVADRIAILEDGKIRQIGAPAEIYDRPASTYVARLLGSPMMNILKSVRGEGGVEAAEGAIRIADKAAPADAVEIGLRPEDIKVRPWLDGEISDGRAGRPARVFEVEPLGGYTVVTLAAGQARLRALLRGQPDIRPDAMVAISCEPARVHYFGQSGGALA